MEEQPGPAFPNKSSLKESTLTADTKPFKCSVPLCNNNFTTLEEYQKSNYKFYDCPEDPMLQLSWRVLCNIPRAKGKVPTPVDFLKICSSHFNFTEPKNTSTAADAKRQERITQDVLKFNINTETKAIKALKGKIAKKKKVVDNKNKKVSCLKLTLESVTKSNQTQKPGHFTLESKLTPAQIEVLKGEKKKVYWSDDDLAQAFSLRHMAGKDFYLYLKNTLNYPLPALACVQAWAGADYDNP